MMGISRQRIIDAVRNNIIWTKLLQPIGSDMSEAEIKAQAIRKTISEFGLTKVQTLPNALPPPKATAPVSAQVIREDAAWVMRTLLSPLSVTLDDAPTTAINGSSSADSAQLPITNIVKRIRYVRHTVRDEPKPAPRSMPLVYRSGGSTGGINISHEFAEPRFRDVATENWRKDQQRTWR